MLGLLFKHRALIFRTRWTLLMVSLMCTGISAGLDQMVKFSNPKVFYEDVFKVTGIFLWATYFVLMSRAWLRERAGARA